MNPFLGNFLGEFFGTAILVLFGNGVVAVASLKRTCSSKTANFMLITFGWGIAVYLGVLVAISAGGPGYINPAVAIRDIVGDLYNGSAATAGAMDTAANSYLVSATAIGTSVGAWLSIPFSIFGAIFGQFVLFLAYYDAFKLEENHGAVLGAHSTGPIVKHNGRNFLTEFIATFVFVGILYSLGTVAEVPAGERADIGTVRALGTLPVALIVMGMGMSLGGPTGYAINPARDLGPRIVHSILWRKRDSNWGYAWIPVAAPLAGGVAMGVIGLAF